MTIKEAITLVKECGFNIATTKHSECEKVVSNVLDLINRQKAEIEMNNAEIKELRSALQGYLDDVAKARNLYKQSVEELNQAKAEIERLKKSNRNWRRKVQRLRKPLPASAVSMMVEQAEHQKQKAEEFIANLKAEAYKEFAERLKGTFPQDDFLRSTKRISEDIDNLLKELIGE